MNSKAICLVVTWLCGSVVLAQETKEVTEQNNVFTERYSVLKLDKRSRQGPYQRYFQERLIEKGDYSQGKHTGVWEFYDLSGKLDQTFDYTTRQVTYSSNYNRPDSVQTLYPVLKGSDTLYVQLAKPPVPIGGVSLLGQTLMMNLRYPISAQRAGKQGTVVLTYLIDEAGKFSAASILRSSGERDMDREALRVINLYGAMEWVPAEFGGTKVSVRLTQPVRFNNMGIINGPR